MLGQAETTFGGTLFPFSRFSRERGLSGSGADLNVDFRYDVWTAFYGRGFADRKHRTADRAGFDEAWSWALAMTREERLERLRAIRQGG
jgi:hypothetical protein